MSLDIATLMDTTFTESKAVIGNKFIGLAVDEDSQSELTDQRVEKMDRAVEKKKISEY